MILASVNFVFFMFLAMWFLARFFEYDHFQGSFLRCIITFFGGVLIYMGLITVAIFPFAFRMI